MSRLRLISLLLVLVTLTVYLPVTRHDFLTYDDDEYVTGNRVVQDGLTLAGVEWAFTTFRAGNWHPITWLSHMADCEFFKLNAGAHHFINVLFHTANAALIFILLVRLTKQTMPAAIVAALFAWHPVHVESVAWIAERKDVLSTFFALLSLLSYAKFVQENCRRSFWFALVFFVIGLLAKPMLVTLPFVMLLLDYWPLQRVVCGGWRMADILRFVTEKAPFFLLAIASCAITFFAQRSSHAVASLEQVSPLFRLENSTVAAASYLLKIFWPAKLAVIYPLEPISFVTFLLAGAALTVISATLWFTRKLYPCCFVGWLWFLGTLVPVSGLVQVGSAAMADRYTYFPAVGIFVAIAFGWDELCKQRPGSEKIFQFTMALLLVACVMLTERQLDCWRNSETLFRHAIAVTKNNDLAHNNLGGFLELQGRTTEALAEYREALNINPRRHQIRFSIGNMLLKTGRPAEALAEYELCINFDPKVPALHNAAGVALVALGEANDAFQEFAEAGRLDPRYPTPHIEAAKIFFAQGRDSNAVDELWIAVRIGPDNFTILSTAARYLAANENDAARDGRKALALALKANELADNHQPVVMDILGMAFAETGDFTNATYYAQNAFELAEAAKMKNAEDIRRRLELYKNHQPWRESFRADNAAIKN